MLPTLDKNCLTLVYFILVGLLLGHFAMEHKVAVLASVSEFSSFD